MQVQLFTASFLSGCLLIGTLAGCATAPEEGQLSAYREAYRDFEHPCVVPEPGHADTFDVMLLKAMRDRGLEPRLLDDVALKEDDTCRQVVRFAVEDGQQVAKGVQGMSLFLRDRKTGETVWVGLGKQTRFGMPDRPTSELQRLDAGILIRQLVERLFPDRLFHEDY
jgi:hypothetical protein